MPTWQSALPYKFQFIHRTCVSGSNVGYRSHRRHVLAGGPCRPINSNFLICCNNKQKTTPGTVIRAGGYCHRVNSFIFQRANPHILSPYPFHSLFRTLSLFSPIIIIALWNLTGRDFPRHFPLIFTSFPRPFPGYSHTLPTHFH